MAGGLYFANGAVRGLLHAAAGVLCATALAAGPARAGGDAPCPTDAPYLADLRQGGFLGKACPSQVALNEALWRYRLTLGSPFDGPPNAGELALLSDRPKRLAAIDALKADLQDDETKRKLIASGALDSDVEHASLPVLREALARFRAAYGFTAIGPLVDAERQALTEARATLDTFAGFKAGTYPGETLGIILPAALVGSAPVPSEEKSWVKYEQKDGALSVHYFISPVRAYTANAMASMLLERRRALYFEHLDIADDEFVFEGSALRRERPGQPEAVRELLMASGREQNGRLFGLHVRAFQTPPATLSVPQLKVALLPAGRLASQSSLPETPAQANWRLIVKSINNLLVSEFSRANGRSAIPIRNCRGVVKAPVLNTSALKISAVTYKTVNIVYATDRKYNGRPQPGDNDQLLNLFGSEAAPTMRVGCLQVRVPDTPQAETSQFLPRSRPWRAGLMFGSAPKSGVDLSFAGNNAPPFEFTLPPEEPREIDLHKMERSYFPADERTNVVSAERALLFIHGYNNSFEEAVKRAAQIAAAADYAGHVYVFSWPSLGSFSRYASDMDAAEQAELDLTQFMRMILTTGVETRLDVIAHSMGSQILLRTLDALRPVFDHRFGPEMDGKVRFGQVIFAAPDVSESVFKRKVQQLRPYTERITVYASANDGALDMSGWIRGERRAGWIDGSGKPVTVSDIDVIDITGHALPRYLVTRYMSSRHSAFAFEKRVLEDIRAILRQSANSEKGARRQPDVRATVAGLPNKFVPGDCAEAKGAKVTWWRMQPDKPPLLPDCGPQMVAQQAPPPK